MKRLLIIAAIVVAVCVAYVFAMLGTGMRGAGDLLARVEVPR